MGRLRRRHRARALAGAMHRQWARGLHCTRAACRAVVCCGSKARACVGPVAACCRPAGGHAARVMVHAAGSAAAGEASHPVQHVAGVRVLQQPRGRPLVACAHTHPPPPPPPHPPRTHPAPCAPCLHTPPPARWWLPRRRWRGPVTSCAARWATLATCWCAARTARCARSTT
jgi:hypothetical protein